MIESLNQAGSFVIDKDRVIIDDDEGEDSKSDDEGGATSRSHVSPSSLNEQQNEIKKILKKKRSEIMKEF
jgi:hypothetical protein